MHSLCHAKCGSRVLADNAAKTSIHVCLWPSECYLMQGVNCSICRHARSEYLLITLLLLLFLLSLCENVLFYSFCSVDNSL